MPDPQKLVHLSRGLLVKSRQMRQFSNTNVTWIECLLIHVHKTNASIP